jgi:hypothetical protein
MSIYEPKGIKFFDLASRLEMILCAEGDEWGGWLAYRHVSGVWVSLREATLADKERIANAQLKAIAEEAK